MKAYYVYILASRSGVLYVGVTNDLDRRIAEHKAKLVPGFTAKYNCDRLVWYESFANINDAIAWEKRIKGWRRSKKISLIAEKNPALADLMICDRAMPAGFEVPRVATAPLGMTEEVSSLRMVEARLGPGQGRGFGEGR
jgi:putative endonuclease